MASSPPDDVFDVPPELPEGDLRTAAPCFRCGMRVANKVGFTWWGGLVGPRLLHHVRCAGCGQMFNARTGSSNGRAIAVYVTVCTIGVILLSIALFAAMRR